uniref:Uncharacterized protein n=1 Tax=viral metagenome TaxID=1070528 RepID=A0A2V0RAG7_9ZZZZ
MKTSATCGKLNTRDLSVGMDHYFVDLVTCERDDISPWVILTHVSDVNDADCATYDHDKGFISLGCGQGTTRGTDIHITHISDMGHTYHICFRYELDAILDAWIPKQTYQTEGLKLTSPYNLICRGAMHSSIHIFDGQ